MYAKPQRGTYRLRYTGMCCPNGLVFHKKSLDMGPIFVQKILKRGSHFTKIVKNFKNWPFLRWKKNKHTLEMGTDFQKKKKKSQISRFFVLFLFLFFFGGGEKSFDMGRSFRPRAAHPMKIWLPSLPVLNIW